MDFRLTQSTKKETQTEPLNVVHICICHYFIKTQDKLMSLCFTANTFTGLWLFMTAPGCKA